MTARPRSRPGGVGAWIRDLAARRWIGLALAVFTLAVTLLVTLYPFRFQLETASWARVDWRVFPASSPAAAVATAAHGGSEPVRPIDHASATKRRCRTTLRVTLCRPLEKLC